MPLPVWAAHKAFRQADVKADEPSLPSQPKPLPPFHPPLPDPSPPPPLPTTEPPGGRTCRQAGSSPRG